MGALSGSQDQTFKMHFSTRFTSVFLGASDEITERFKNTNFIKQKEMLQRSLLEMLEFFVSHTSTPYMELLAMHTLPNSISGLLRV